MKALVLHGHNSHHGEVSLHESVNKAGERAKMDPDRIFISLRDVSEMIERIQLMELSPEAALLDLDPDKPKGY